jgi:hypothetical protein
MIAPDRPQADGNDRGKTSSEPMLAGQLLRLRCVRVAPGRCVVLMVMVVGMGMHVAMMMIVAMRVVMIMAMVVIVVMVAMIVRMLRMLFAAQQTQEGTAFHPQQAQADQYNQRITDNFDDADGVTHRFCRRTKERGGDPDNGNSRECLQHRRCKREHDASAPGFVIRDQIRRNHRLSVARPGGVKYSVEERDAEQRIGSTSVSLGRAYQTGERAVEFGLLGQNPAGKSADFGRWGSARHAERLRERPIHRRDKKQMHAISKT